MMDNSQAKKQRGRRNSQLVASNESLATTATPTTAQPANAIVVSEGKCLQYYRYLPVTSADGHLPWSTSMAKCHILIKSLCRQLGFPFQTFASAFCLLHRYLHVESLVVVPVAPVSASSQPPFAFAPYTNYAVTSSAAKTNRNTTDLAIAALFSASKLEETVCKSREYLVHVWRVLWRRDVDADHPEVADYRKRMLVAEREILIACDFRFDFSHPHRFLLKVVKMLMSSAGAALVDYDEFGWMCWRVLEESYVLPVCVHYSHIEIACGVVFLVSLLRPVAGFDASTFSIHSGAFWVDHLAADYSRVLSIAKDIALMMAESGSNSDATVTEALIKLNTLIESNRLVLSFKRRQQELQRQRDEEDRMALERPSNSRRPSEDLRSFSQRTSRVHTPSHNSSPHYSSYPSSRHSSSSDLGRHFPRKTYNRHFDHFRRSSDQPDRPQPRIVEDPLKYDNGRKAVEAHLKKLESRPTPVQHDQQFKRGPYINSSTVSLDYSDKSLPLVEDPVKYDNGRKAVEAHLKKLESRPVPSHFDQQFTAGYNRRQGSSSQDFGSRTRDDHNDNSSKPRHFDNQSEKVSGGHEWKDHDAYDDHVRRFESLASRSNSKSSKIDHRETSHRRREGHEFSIFKTPMLPERKVQHHPRQKEDYRDLSVSPHDIRDRDHERDPKAYDRRADRSRSTEKYQYRDKSYSNRLSEDPAGARGKHYDRYHGGGDRSKSRDKNHEIREMDQSKDEPIRYREDFVKTENNRPYKQPKKDTYMPNRDGRKYGDDMEREKDRGRSHHRSDSDRPRESFKRGGDYDNGTYLRHKDYDHNDNKRSRTRSPHDQDGHRSSGYRHSGSSDHNRSWK
eukprot:Partr_v1_DN28837_c1_g1_i1_m34198